MERMTAVEKRYLLFLSPRTPRPKQCDQPSQRILKRMLDRNWISVTHSWKFKIPTYYITGPGELALTRATSPGPWMKSEVHWREVECMPEGYTCLITDGSNVRAGVREGDTMIAGLVTPLSHWTHWAAMPTLPIGIPYIPERAQ